MRPSEVAASIRRQARKFREFVERCDKSELELKIQDFPRGSCGDVACLLARYLSEGGAPGFRYFLGQRRKPEQKEPTFASHAWLQLDDLIVDITADQFSEVREPVIVTRMSAWHATLRGEDKGIADYRQRYAHEPRVFEAFEVAYDCIVSA